MRRLSESEFKETMGTPMRRRDADHEPPFDFWRYFDTLPTNEFLGHDFSEGLVDGVYAEPRGRFEHVLVDCAESDVYLVLVLDLERGAVHGHQVLNLRVEYGLDD